MTDYRDATPPAAIPAAASDWIVRREAGLSAAEEAEFQHWLVADPRHAEAVARLEKTWARLDRPRRAGRAGEMTAALLARAQGRRRRRRGAAVAALLLMVSLAAVWQRRTPALPAAPTANAVVLAARQQVLPDGTRIELSPGAEIAADFDGPLRRVSLRRGQALFHVAKDAQRPFVVSASGVDVRAIGTAFSVQVAERGVEVVVTEGQVAVERTAAAPVSPPGPGAGSPPAPPAAPETHSTVIDAGKRISVDLLPGAAAPQPVAISAAEIAERLAWRATRIEFSHTPLAEAVALLNRHSAVQLVVDDAKLAGVPVNGLFRADNTEALVRILEASFGVTAERQGDVITLRRQP